MMMDTALSKLYHCLNQSGIFYSQNVFFSCIFSRSPSESITYVPPTETFFSDTLIYDIKQELKHIYEHHETVSLSSKTIYEFFCFCSGMKVNTDVKYVTNKFPSLKNYENARFDVPYISKVMNGKKTVPKEWREMYRYSQNNEKKWSYIESLAWILQLYSLIMNISNDGIIEINKIPEQDPVRVNYCEYYSPSKRLLALINHNIKPVYNKKIGTFLELALCIYDSILKQCISLEKVRVKRFESFRKNITNGNVRDINEQIRFYLEKIDIYGKDSIDRFNKLREFADKNVMCAYELGNMYSQGCVLDIRNQPYIIEQNWEESLRYFMKCTVSDTIKPYKLYYRASYRIADMILKGIIDIEENDRWEYALEYLEDCKDFAPAIHLTAVHHKKLADQLFTKRKHDQELTLNDDDTSLLLYHYTQFLIKDMEAFKRGWMYAGNNIALFLIEDRYKNILPYLPAIGDLGINAKDILTENACIGSPWAKMRLAQIYMQDGKTKRDSENGKKAKELLEDAHRYHYSVATYYLAYYFYKETDRERYIELVKESANGDYFRAKEELERFQRGR